MRTRRTARLARTSAPAQTHAAAPAPTWQPPVVAWPVRPWQPWAPPAQPTPHLLPPEARRSQPAPEPSIWVPQPEGQGVAHVPRPALHTSMTATKGPRAGEWFAMLANAKVFEEGSQAMSIVGIAAVLVSRLYCHGCLLWDFEAPDVFIVSLRIASKMKSEHPGSSEEWLSSLHAARMAAACYQTGSNLAARVPSMQDLNGTETALLQSLGWRTMVPREQSAEALRRLRAQPPGPNSRSLVLASDRISLPHRLKLLVKAGVGNAREAQEDQA